MNTKKFTVVDTRANRIRTFESTANTVGELKADLLREGINPTDMAIQEGLTKTELPDDDSAYLPHDVSYRGSITNNLVFRLTLKEKKIKSGAMSRTEAYAKIKTLGIADKIANKYGKNFTMCKTADLINEIDATTKSTPKKVKTTAKNTDSCPTTDTLIKLVIVLVEKNVLSRTEGNAIVSKLGVTLPVISEYSASEIDEMFANM